MRAEPGGKGKRATPESRAACRRRGIMDTCALAGAYVIAAGSIVPKVKARQNSQSGRYTPCAKGERRDERIGDIGEPSGRLVKPLERCTGLDRRLVIGEPVGGVLAAGGSG
jgi:hypothetical protein